MTDLDTEALDFQNAIIEEPSTHVRLSQAQITERVQTLKKELGDFGVGPAMTRKQRAEFRQAIHFVPAHNTKFAQKAVDKRTEFPSLGVLLNLEDGVQPSEKVTARQALSDVFKTYPNERFSIRINDLHTQWFEDDCLAAGALGDRVSFVMVSKAESVTGIQYAQLLVRKGMMLAGHDPSAVIPMHPLIESVAGINHAIEIAEAFGSHIHGMSLGLADASADSRKRTVGVGQDNPRAVIANRYDPANPDGPRILTPVSLMDSWMETALRACKGVNPKLKFSAGPYALLDDKKGFSIFDDRNFVNGGDMAWTLVPDQIPLAIAAMSPQVEAVHRALEKVQAMPDGKNGRKVNGEFVDEATWKVEVLNFIWCALKVAQLYPEKSVEYFGPGGPTKNPAIIAAGGWRQLLQSTVS